MNDNGSWRDWRDYDSMSREELIQRIRLVENEHKQTRIALVNELLAHARTIGETGHREVSE